MISLLFLIALVVLVAVTTGWVLAWAARAVGSQRGRFRLGVMVAAALMVFNLSLGIIGRSLPAQDRGAIIAIELILGIFQLVVAFLLLRRAFSLSTKRALAPFAALLAISAIQVVFVLAVFRPHLTESMVIPTGAMAPTIESGSRVFVNKIIQPRRLDLVVYWNHDNPPLMFCKRLIGLPGERLRFEDGGIFVNDQPIHLPPVLAGRCRASVRGPRGEIRYRDGETIALAENEYFFIGDNVELSADSRLFGPTQGSSLVGVVDLIYWPWNRAAVVR